MAADELTGLVARMSVSLPESQLAQLDDMVRRRGFASRSQAIGEMLHHGLMEEKRQLGDEVMVGTITLFYDNSYTGLQKKLADLQADNITEVISSLHVHLQGNQTLEVILVQGPPTKLQDIADAMITLRGVISGHTRLVAAVIPQLHPLPNAGPKPTMKRPRKPLRKSKASRTR